LEKETKVLKEENKKLMQLAKSQVRHIIEPAAKKGDVGANQDSPASQCSLGAILVQQKDDAKANERGVDLLKKSAATEYPEAQHEVALCQLRGTTVPKDEKSAVELLKKSADSGFALSQCELGDCFANGVGVEKDAKQAETWFLKAAENGSLYGQRRLGNIYEEDAKLKDINKAIEWYEKAYYSGSHTLAPTALLNLFSPDKKNEVADREKAMQWAFRGFVHHLIGYFLLRKDQNKIESVCKGMYRSAIHESNWHASFNNLSHCSEEKYRHVLYRRSAFLDCSYAMFFYVRDFADSDPKKLKYIRKSAEASSSPYPEAQWKLGEWYETGAFGGLLKKDVKLAKEWKDKALANGYNPNEFHHAEDEEGEEEEEEENDERW
jgi:TPR repeat protein